MKKYKDIIINVKGDPKRKKEVEELAKKLNISKEELEEQLSNMYIMKGAKYEDYFRT